MDMNKIMAQARKQGYTGDKRPICAMCDSEAWAYNHYIERWLCGPCTGKITKAFEKATEEERKKEEEEAKKIKDGVLKEIGELKF